MLTIVQFFGNLFLLMSFLLLLIPFLLGVCVIVWILGSIKDEWVRRREIKRENELWEATNKKLDEFSKK
jgi:hypothetical protein